MSLSCIWESKLPSQKLLLSLHTLQSFLQPIHLIFPNHSILQVIKSKQATPTLSLCQFRYRKNNCTYFFSIIQMLNWLSPLPRTLSRPIGFSTSQSIIMEELCVSIDTLKPLLYPLYHVSLIQIICSYKISCNSTHP